MTSPMEPTLGGWLVHVLREADGALSMEEALHVILDSMKTYFPAQSVALVLIDDDTNEARIKMSRQISYSFTKEFHRKSPGARIEALLLSQEPVLVARGELRDASYEELRMEHDFTSAVIAPVVKNHRSVGYVFCDRLQEAAFADSDLLHLQVIGFLIGSLMVKFELLQERKQLSPRDDATGMLKYGAFVAGLGRELKRAEVHHYPVSLVLLQLPCFRDFLDTYGIDKAHAVLEQLGKVIGRHAREMDLLARYSADRVILCLSGMTEPEVLKLLESVRGEACREIGAGTGIAVRVPCGILVLESDAAKRNNLQTIVGVLGKSLVDAGVPESGGIHVSRL